MSSDPTRPILAIVGVTASGKSQLALELARRHAGIELVSIDSMQIYRCMDVGTAKPTRAERAEIPHHLIDLVEPYQEFSVSEFQFAASEAIGEIESRGNQPVLVGGTGLHLRAVVDDLRIPGQYPDVVADLDGVETSALHNRLVELDPESAGRMEASNRRRIVRALEVTLGSGMPFSSFGPGLSVYPESRYRMIGPRWDRSSIDGRIEQRYERQLADGFVGEVEALAAMERPLSRTAAQALGYRQLLAHVRGECSLDEAVEAAMVATRRFARRQERWFRRDPRITWVGIDENPMEAMAAVVGEYELCV
ncbi:MAG: tRNA (adenosine(37)-N6)-dimethylallyltransferase MiaA [Acidimicrobiales bacterium]